MTNRNQANASSWIHVLYRSEFWGGLCNQILRLQRESAELPQFGTTQNTNAQMAGAIFEGNIQSKYTHWLYVTDNSCLHALLLHPPNQRQHRLSPPLSAIPILVLGSVPKINVTTPVSRSTNAMFLLLQIRSTLKSTKDLWN